MTTQDSFVLSVHFLKMCKQLIAFQIRNRISSLRNVNLVTLYKVYNASTLYLEIWLTDSFFLPFLFPFFLVCLPACFQFVCFVLFFF